MQFFRHYWRLHKGPLLTPAANLLSSHTIQQMGIWELFKIKCHGSFPQPVNIQNVYISACIWSALQAE